MDKNAGKYKGEEVDKLGRKSTRDEAKFWGLKWQKSPKWVIFAIFEN